MSAWSYFLIFINLLVVNIIPQIIKIHNVGGTLKTADFDSVVGASTNTLAPLEREKLYCTSISRVASDS